MNKTKHVIIFGTRPEDKKMKPLVKEFQKQGKFDAIILTVAHKEFAELDVSQYLKEDGIIYDVKGILDSNTIHKRL